MSEDYLLNVIENPWTISPEDEPRIPVSNEPNLISKQHYNFFVDKAPQVRTVPEHLRSQYDMERDFNALWNEPKSRETLADDLYPYITDNIQREETRDYQIQQLIKKVPESRVNDVVIENSNPVDLVSFGLNKEVTQEEMKFYGPLTERLSKSGFNVSPERTKEIVLGEYFRGALALQSSRAEHSWLGNFTISAGASIVQGLTTPLGLALGVTTAVAAGTLAPFLGLSMAATAIAAEGINVLTGAALNVPINQHFVNARRRDLGLEPLNLTESFGDDILAGATLSAALGAIGLGVYGVKFMGNRAIYIAQNSRRRFKNTGIKSDAELKSEFTGTPEDSGDNPIVSGYSGTSPTSTYTIDPKIPVWGFDSDPGTPELNRQMYNNAHLMTAGTRFAEDITPERTAKLKSYMQKFSVSENYIWSEAARVSKENKGLEQEFKDALIFASTKDDYVKRLRKTFLGEDQKLKEYIREDPKINLLEASDKVSLHDYLIKERILEAHEDASERFPTFNHEELRLHQNNPYGHLVGSSETVAASRQALGLAKEWETIRARALSNGMQPDQELTISNYLMSEINQLNLYSSERDAGRAKYFNKVGPLIEKTSAEDLIKAFSGVSTTSDAHAIKNTLSDVKRERRAVAAQHGIDYGEIEDHVPQKWASEAVMSTPFDDFFNDFFDALDHEKTKHSYDYDTRQFKLNAERELDAEVKKFDENTKRRVIKFDERIKTAEKLADKQVVKTFKEGERLRSSVSKVFTGINKTITGLENSSEMFKSLLDQQKIARKEGRIFEKEVSTQGINLTKAHDESKLISSQIKETDKSIKDAQTILQKEREKAELYEQYRSAEKLSSILENINEDSSGAEKRQVVKYYNFMKRLKLVPERRDNRAFLSDDDFDALDAGIKSIPEKKIKAKDSALTYNAQRFLASEGVERLKLLKSKAEDVRDIADRSVALKKEFEKRYFDAMLKSTKSAEKRILDERESKRESLLSKLHTAEEKIKRSEDVLSTSKDLLKVFNLEDQDKMAAITAEYNKRYSANLNRINEGRVVEGLKSFDQRSRNVLEKINTSFEKTASVADKEAGKISARAEASIKKIKARDLTTPITRLIERIEKFEKILKKPLGVEEMEQIYNNIASDDLLSYQTSGSGANVSGTKRRILHFADFASFEQLNRKYGVTADIRLLLKRDIESNIRDIARLHALEGSPEFYKKLTERNIDVLRGDKPLTFTQKNLKGIVNANIDYISGLTNNEPIGVAGTTGRLYKSLVRMSALGGAGLTALFDDAQQAGFMGMENGLGLLRTLQYYVKGLAKAKLSPGEASRLGIALDSLDLAFHDETVRDMQSKTAAKIDNAAKKIDQFTFRINGVEYITERGREAWTRLFLGELPFIEKNNKIKDTLKSFGLDDRDFKAITALEVSDDGIPIFTSEFKNTKSYRKLLGAIHTTRRKAIAMTSQSFKAVMNTSTGILGTGMGIVDSLFFLKRIPLQVFFDHILLPVMRQEYGKMASYAVQNAIFTTLRLSLKYMAMGYTPDYTDPAFYAQVLSQSAVVPPIVSDILNMKAISAYDISKAAGRAVVGAYSPALDVANLSIATLTGDKKRNALIVRAIKDFAPIKTHPALAAMYERFVFDNMQTALDPKAHEYLARREKSRRETGLIRR